MTGTTTTPHINIQIVLNKRNVPTVLIYHAFTSSSAAADANKFGTAVKNVKSRIMMNIKIGVLITDIRKGFFML
jgi:hypothetical protein